MRKRRPIPIAVKPPARTEVVPPDGDLTGETTLAGKIARLERALAKSREHYWTAIADIGKQGIGKVKEVGDNHGVTRKKLGINPSLRVLRESASAIKLLEAELSELKAKLDESSNPVDEFERNFGPQ